MGPKLTKKDNSKKKPTVSEKERKWQDENRKILRIVVTTASRLGLAYEVHKRIWEECPLGPSSHWGGQHDYQCYLGLYDSKKRRFMEAHEEREAIKRSVKMLAEKKKAEERQQKLATTTNASSQERVGENEGQAIANELDSYTPPLAIYVLVIENVTTRFRTFTPPFRRSNGTIILYDFDSTNPPHYYSKTVEEQQKEDAVDATTDPHQHPSAIGSFQMLCKQAQYVARYSPEETRVLAIGIDTAGSVVTTGRSNCSASCRCAKSRLTPSFATLLARPEFPFKTDRGRQVEWENVIVPTGDVQWATPRPIELMFPGGWEGPDWSYNGSNRELGINSKAHIQECYCSESQFCYSNANRAYVTFVLFKVAESRPIPKEVICYILRLYYDCTPDEFSMRSLLRHFADDILKYQEDEL